MLFVNIYSNAKNFLHAPFYVAQNTYLNFLNYKIEVQLFYFNRITVDLTFFKYRKNIKLFKNIRGRIQKSFTSAKEENQMVSRVQVAERLMYIKFLTKEINRQKVLYERMPAVYGDNTPSYYMVKYWSKELRWDHTSIEDDLCSERPATTPKMVAKIEKIADPRIVK